MSTHPSRAVAPLARWVGGMVLAAVVLLSGCASLPGSVSREASQAYTDVAATPLAREAAQATPDDKRHLSGLRLVPNGPEAFAARVAMARGAQRSLDAQYYYVGNDESGRQFLRELRDAAARGVRVRLLVDDLHASELDPVLLGLAAHEGVQVRLFNPLPVRGAGFEARMFFSLHQFDRVNRRMHNKLFIADNAVAMTGGRNIANEYFLRSDSANFIDMDVQSIGPAVRNLSEVFDRYWNSELSYPVEALVAPVGADAAQARSLFDAWAERNPRLPAAPVPDAIAAVQWAFAPVQVVADEPSKAAGSASAGPQDNAMNSALTLMRSAHSEVFIVSPYFVPGQRGLELMRTAIDHGVRVSVMTNSLAATDEPLAYWAYARYRGDMLKLGVSLSELSPEPSRKFDLLGNARSSLGRLHAKVAVVDRRWLLVGSMNMDGRSSRSNTEVGLVIDHIGLANEALDAMQGQWSESHYRLRLSGATDAIEWTTADDDGTSVLPGGEPQVNWLQRLRLGVLSMFVAEDLL